MVDKIEKTDTFQKILIQGIKSHMFPMQSRKARDWFRKAAQEFRKSPKSLLAERILTQEISIGDCLIFNYDPKWKEELPYYDTFPCIFVVDIYDDGFLGINLHYLDYESRAKLMDALYSTMKIGKDDVRLRISYQILKNASRFDNFSPCLKRYLTSHVRSAGFLKVEAVSYDIALFLPIARFKKASETTVWQDSRTKIASRKSKNRWYRRIFRFATGQGFGRK